MCGLMNDPIGLVDDTGPVVVAVLFPSIEYTIHRMSKKCT